MSKTSFSEESLFYKVLFENKLMGISIANGFRLIKVNDAFCNMLGYTHEQFITKEVMDITIKDKNDNSREYIGKLINKEIENFTVVKKYRHKSNKIVYAETNVSGVYDENGNYLMSVAMHQDISDKIAANNELETNEVLFRGIFENSPLGITINTIKNGNLRNVNSGFCEILGYSQDELYHLSVKELTHPSDQGKHLSLFSKLRANEIDSFVLEKRYLHKSGKSVWANTKVSTIRNSEGDLIYDFAIVEDVTIRRKSEKKLKRNNNELKKINEELDHFVYRTSHDLKAPLSSILGLINLTRLDKSTNPYEMFDIIESQIHRLENFIKDIIDYFRISRVENHFSKIDFNELIKSSLEDNKYVNGFGKVDVSLKVDGECEFHTNINKMKIIFNNLISNAIKYYDAHKASSYLQIIISKSYKKATKEIIDNGMGIKKERISKLFTMSYRTTDTGQGSSLGLFIIKEALNTIKGEIFKDTTIKITIPNKL